jgi:hypothetical protein
MLNFQEASRLSLILEQNKHIKHAAYANEIARPFPAPETNQLQLFCLPIASPILEFPLKKRVKKYVEISSNW